MNAPTTPNAPRPSLLMLGGRYRPDHRQVNHFNPHVERPDACIAAGPLYGLDQYAGQVG
jgi:hypothetical protein